MSSNLSHLQRASLVDNRCMLIGMGSALVAIGTEGTALYHSCITLIVLHEILERVSFARILLDALHDTLTADCAIVRNIIVHTRVWL